MKTKEELVKEIAKTIKEGGNFHSQDMFYAKDKDECMRWWDEKYRKIAVRIVALLDK